MARRIQACDLTITQKRGFRGQIGDNVANTDSRLLHDQFKLGPDGADRKCKTGLPILTTKTTSSPSRALVGAIRCGLTIETPVLVAEALVNRRMVVTDVEYIVFVLELEIGQLLVE